MKTPKTMSKAAKVIADRNVKNASKVKLTLGVGVYKAEKLKRILELADEADALAHECGLSVKLTISNH